MTGGQVTSRNRSSGSTCCRPASTSIQMEVSTRIIVLTLLRRPAPSHGRRPPACSLPASQRDRLPRDPCRRTVVDSVSCVRSRFPPKPDLRRPSRFLHPALVPLLPVKSRQAQDLY